MLGDNATAACSYTSIYRYFPRLFSLFKKIKNNTVSPGRQSDNDVNVAMGWSAAAAAATAAVAGAGGRPEWHLDRWYLEYGSELTTDCSSADRSSTMELTHFSMMSVDSCCADTEGGRWRRCSCSPCTSLASAACSSLICARSRQNAPQATPGSAPSPPASSRHAVRCRQSVPGGAHASRDGDDSRCPWSAGHYAPGA